MCIAIVNKAGTLPLETFTTSFRNNPDGIGMAWTDGSEVRTLRTMNAPEQLHARYLEVREETPHPILIHSRISTHGVKDLGNCHPFKVSKNLALIHNGIVNAPTYRPDRSDTWHLVDLLRLMRNPSEAINADSPEGAWLEELAGYSKIALLHVSGVTRIIGESKGTWENGSWFSNATHKDTCRIIDRGGISYGAGYFDLTDEPTYKPVYESEFFKSAAILRTLGDDPDTLPYQGVIDRAKKYAKEWQYNSVSALYADTKTWGA